MQNNMVEITAKLFNRLLLEEVMTFVEKEEQQVFYIKSSFDGYKKQKSLGSSKAVYEQVTDDDFEGNYLGESSISLCQASLKDEPKIFYENEKDLLEKIVQFIWKGSESYEAISLDDPLEVVLDKASARVYSRYSRGEASVIFCAPNFLEKHKLFGDDLDAVIIAVDCLPDNLAVTAYKSKKSDNNISILAYRNSKEKWIKLKNLVDYSVVLFEED